MREIYEAHEPYHLTIMTMTVRQTTSTSLSKAHTEHTLHTLAKELVAITILASLYEGKSILCARSIHLVDRPKKQPRIRNGQQLHHASVTLRLDPPNDVPGRWLSN